MFLFLMPYQTFFPDNRVSDRDRNHNQEKEKWSRGEGGPVKLFFHQHEIDCFAPGHLSPEPASFTLTAAVSSAVFCCLSGLQHCDS